MTPIQMARRNPAVFLVSAGFLLLAACNPFGGGDPGGGGLSRAESIIATATARASEPVPTPTPTTPVEASATPLPTPTPTPSPTVVQALAESLVWAEVSGCAEQIAAAPAEGERVEAAVVEVSVVFTSAYDPRNLRWVVDVATNDDLLSFGQWAVTDETTPSVTARDATAGRIAAGDSRCALPAALLDDVPTPPLFLAIEVLVPNAELAATQVWTSVYGCFEEFPAFTSFSGRAGLEGSWIVEGRSATTQYGLWEVDAVSAAITPRDEIAKQVQESCPTDVQPTVVTGEEASIRTWVAAYDCFTPRPLFDAFTTRQEDPRQWIVEGRGTEEIEVDVEIVTEGGTETFTEIRTVTAFYGLWLVNTETGSVSGVDNLAIAMATDICFKELP